MLNARSLCNKLHLFSSYVSEFCPDFITITETWGHELLSNSIFELENYTLFRKDRINRRGGGVMIYVHTRFVATACDSLTDPLVEALFCEVSIGRCTLLLGVVYRPPFFDQSSHLIDLLRKASHTSASYLFITGDFNYPEIDWEHFNWPRGVNDFMNVVLDSSWSQMVTAPTRGDHILDLLFTKNPESVSSIIVQEPLGDSDHSMVTASISVTDSIQHGTTGGDHRYNWKKADWVSFERELQCWNWNLFYVSGNVDHIYNNIKDCIWSSCHACVPLLPRKSQNRPAWETSTVRQARKNRRAAEMNYRLNRNDESRILRNRAANHLKQAVRKAVIDYERNIALSEDPKRFWKYVKRKQKPHPKVGPLYDPNCGLMTKDSKRCAELFAEVYATHFTADDKHTPLLTASTSAELKTIDFSPALVQSQLKRMRSDACPGPDGITYMMLKRGGSFLLHQLVFFYQYCMNNSVIPTDWKQATVVPVYKKGARSSMANYRPISLTSCVAKLMEACVRDTLFNFWQSNNAIRSSQFGFIPKSSCCDQLIVYLNKVTKAVDRGSWVDAVYLDLAKAFNTVSHNKLLIKLVSMGVTDNLLKWLETFLCGRTEVVSVLGERSDPYCMTSGVPQGSVLGPLLFVAYVNDVDEVIRHATLLKYADDMKLYIQLERSDSNGQHSLLQDDLNSLQQWLDQWQLRLAPDKCKVVHFGKHNPHLSYSLRDIPLQDSCEERDLGIIISADLKFESHISKVVKKAEGVLASITRAFVSRSPQVYLRLFTTLVRPILEYASPVWNPALQVNLCKRLEAVQRRATRRIPGLCTLTYANRLSLLNMESLELRRKVSDLVFLYKLVRRHDGYNLFTFSSSSRTRGHRYKIMPQHVKLNVRKNFFTNRIVGEWNALPSQIVALNSIHHFKNALRKEFKKSIPK